jgi:hypothetical protein
MVWFAGVPPFTRVKLSWLKAPAPWSVKLRVIPWAFPTLTVQEAVNPPSTVVAVITAVPMVFAVTSPALETVATVVLFEFQVRSLLTALAGTTDAKRFPVPFTARVIVVLFRLTPVTAALTVKFTLLVQGTVPWYAVSVRVCPPTV